MHWFSWFHTQIMCNPFDVTRLQSPLVSMRWPAAEWGYYNIVLSIVIFLSSPLHPTLIYIWLQFFQLFLHVLYNILNITCNLPYAYITYIMIRIKKVLSYCSNDIYYSIGKSSNMFIYTCNVLPHVNCISLWWTYM